MKIAFLGLPLAALALLADGHDVGLALIAVPGAPGTRRLQRRLGQERVLVRPRLDEHVVKLLDELRPDLLVSWFWTTRIPMALVSRARLGGIGVHPSLLPRHRGPDPVSHAILAGDAETGVTCHRIAAEYGTGAILAQRRHPIPARIDTWRLGKAPDRPSLALLREVCALFGAGRPPEERGQDESLATEAPLPEDADLALRWDAPADEVLRRVRAYAPSPGVFTEIAGQAVTLLEAELVERSSGLLDRPGEACFVGGKLLVRARDREVSLLRAEIDGVAVGPEALGRMLSG